MSDETIINLVGCIVWFFIGAAVLAGLGRGLLDLAESVSKEESLKNTTLPVIGVPGVAAVLMFVWLVSCLLWPFQVYRYIRGYGLIKGHIARECQYKEQRGERRSEPRFRHGAACRRKER
jgi:hypothetical protein